MKLKVSHVLFIFGIFAAFFFIANFHISVTVTTTVVKIGIQPRTPPELVTRQARHAHQQHTPQQEHVSSSETEAVTSTNLSSSSEPSVCEGDQPNPRYSSHTCLDGNDGWIANASSYGFIVINRTCVYHDLEWNQYHGWTYYLNPSGARGPPPVSLSSVPFDLPITGWKRDKLRKKINPTMSWTPRIVRGAIPCARKRYDTKKVILYYSPVVAPWNFAHTLFNDLFGVFWGMWEHGLHRTPIENLEVSLWGGHYAELIHHGTLHKNKAFHMFARNPVHYDHSHAHETVYRTMMAGIGTKSWMFFRDGYKGSGNRHVWSDFRAHLMSVTGVADRVIQGDAPTTTTVPRKMVICHKKDKRGLVNYDDIVTYVHGKYPNRVEVNLVELPKLSAADQIRTMVEADIFLCNEGTLATSFFFMPKGAVFISVPLVYHSPHLHVVNMIHDKKQWWRQPDPMRPDPRKQTGGNIDWFPQVVPWVRVLWYAQIPLNETVIQLPLENLRNYMPENNVRINVERLGPILKRGLELMESSAIATELPNYSINAAMCDVLLQRHPELVVSFNSARCYFGKSWLCEFLTNTDPSRRYLHEKWRLSKGRCGTSAHSTKAENIADPRDAWNSELFTFYNTSNVHFRFDF